MPNARPLRFFVLACLAACLLQANPAGAFQTAEQSARAQLVAYAAARAQGDDESAYQAARAYASAVGEHFNAYREYLALAELGRFAEAIEGLENLAQIAKENYLQTTRADQAYIGLVQGRIHMLQGRLAAAKDAFAASAALIGQADAAGELESMHADFATENQIWLDYTGRLLAQGSELPPCAQDAGVRKLIAADALAACLKPELPAPVIRRALFSLASRPGAAMHSLGPWLERHETRPAAISTLGRLATPAELSQLVSYVNTPDALTQETALRALDLALKRLGEAVTPAARGQTAQTLLDKVLDKQTPLGPRLALIDLLGTLGDRRAEPVLRTLLRQAEKMSAGGTVPQFPGLQHAEAVEAGLLLRNGIHQALSRL